MMLKRKRKSYCTGIAFTGHTAIIFGAVAATVHAEPPTFSRDVAPIIFANCSECHRPNQVAPFSLITYDDVRKRGKQIVEVTHTRYMPPWLPNKSGDAAFLGSRGLSDQQIQTIRTWFEQGMIEGETSDHPKAPDFTDDWQHGTPDLVLRLAEPFTLEAQTNDTIRTFVFAVELPEAGHVKAIDFRTNAPRAVHHASFLIDTTGTAKQLDAADPAPGYASMGDIGLNLAGSLGAWSPGGTPPSYSEGIGHSLPAKCDLAVEVHFNPTGKPEAVQPQIAIYFASTPMKHEIVSFSMGSFFLDIAAGEKQYRIADSFVLPVDSKLLAFTPHAHYVCKRLVVAATLPNGQVRTLLKIDDWDFNWQQEYRLSEPMNLPAGTQIDFHMTYDNSADNPRNPSNPPRRVRLGATAADEMALLFLHMIAIDESERPILAKAHHEQLIQRMREAQRKRGQQKNEE